MIQISWQTIAWIVFGLLCLKGIVTSLYSLYATIYKSGYTLGRSTMEAEDTNQLLKAIVEVKAEFPEAELALAFLFDKLTGQPKDTKKKEVERTPIGFKSDKKKEGTDA